MTARFHLGVAVRRSCSWRRNGDSQHYRIRFNKKSKKDIKADKSQVSITRALVIVAVVFTLTCALPALVLVTMLIVTGGYHGMRTGASYLTMTRSAAFYG